MLLTPFIYRTHAGAATVAMFAGTRTTFNPFWYTHIYMFDSMSSKWATAFFFCVPLFHFLLISFNCSHSRCWSHSNNYLLFVRLFVSSLLTLWPVRWRHSVLFYVMAFLHRCLIVDRQLLFLLLEWERKQERKFLIEKSIVDRLFLGGCQVARIV